MRVTSDVTSEELHDDPQFVCSDQVAVQVVNDVAVPVLLHHQNLVYYQILLRLERVDI